MKKKGKSVINMEELRIAQELLKKIVEEDQTFHDVTKALRFNKDNKEAKPLNKETVSIVSSLLGSELRHHLFLSEMTKTLKLSNDNRYLLMLALSNNFYFKRLNAKDVNAYVKKTLGEEYNEDIEKMLTHEGDLIEAFPGESNFRQEDLIPARFNIPSYLFKMWQKHFGKGLTYKFLKKNIKPASQYLRVNLAKTSPNALLSANPDFVKTEFEDFLTYKGTKPLRKTEEYSEYKFFNEKVGLKTVIDEVWNRDLQYVTVYSGEDDSLVREAIMRSVGKVGLSVGLPTFETRAEILHIQRAEKPKNLNLFEVFDLGMMDAAITNKQDLIIIMPKSSSFDRIRQYPDYLMHFKQSSFDGLIANQSLALESFAKYLDEDGQILYIVDTLNKKESVGVVTDFLNKHEDFKLVKWHQKFPHENEDTTLFYAILAKKNSSDKDE